MGIKEFFRLQKEQMYKRWFDNIDLTEHMTTQYDRDEAKNLIEEAIGKDSDRKAFLYLDKNKFSADFLKECLWEAKYLPRSLSCDREESPLEALAYYILSNCRIELEEEKP